MKNVSTPYVTSLDAATRQRPINSATCGTTAFPIPRNRSTRWETPSDTRCILPAGTQTRVSCSTSLANCCSLHAPLARDWNPSRRRQREKERLATINIRSRRKWVPKNPLGMQCHSALNPISASVPRTLSNPRVSNAATFSRTTNRGCNSQTKRMASKNNPLRSPSRPAPSPA